MHADSWTLASPTYLQALAARRYLIPPRGFSIVLSDCLMAPRAGKADQNRNVSSPARAIRSIAREGRGAKGAVAATATVRAKTQWSESSRRQRTVEAKASMTKMTHLLR